jgi:hypothetical protein
LVSKSQYLQARKGSYVFGRGVALEVGLDALVLLVEVCQIRDKVLDDVGMRKRVDLDVGSSLGRDTAQAGKGVLAVNVHGTATTDTLTATSSEGQSRVKLVLDSDKGIENHGSSLVKIQSVGLETGLLAGGIGVPSVDLEGLHLGLGLLGRLADGGHRTSEDSAGANGSRP